MLSDPGTWRLCSGCKAPLAFEASHYRCSVSTCNKKRVFYAFCSVPCWEAHREESNHRDAWAEPQRAPTEEQWAVEQAKERGRVERILGSPDPSSRRVEAPYARRQAPVPQEVSARRGAPREVLVVASRCKAYVEAKSKMSVGEPVFRALSDHLRELLERAAGSAAKDGRKTLLERDVLPLLESRQRLHPFQDDPRLPQETLVVVSRLKDYVKVAFDFNTSDAVIGPLSLHLRHMVTEALRNAARDDRRTVLARDVVKATDAHLGA
jgi:histone H3/H4